MARIKRFFKRRVSYEPLEDGGEGEEVGPSSASNRNPGTRFSWTIYFIFLLLGIAMLWAWCVQVFDYTLQRVGFNTH